MYTVTNQKKIYSNAPNKSATCREKEHNKEPYLYWLRDERMGMGRQYFRNTSFKRCKRMPNEK